MASISASAFAKSETIEREAGVKLKLGFNAYSFNKQLREDSLTLADTVHFCAKQGVVVAVQQRNDFLKTAAETETRNRRSE
jgi:poly-D-alanine transfer protein DltD